jgi:hypothetical protein
MGSYLRPHGEFAVLTAQLLSAHCVTDAYTMQFLARSTLERTSSTMDMSHLVGYQYRHDLEALRLGQRMLKYRQSTNINPTEQEQQQQQ